MRPRVNTTDLRRSLRDVLNRVEFYEEVLELERHGKVVALIVPVPKPEQGRCPLCGVSYATGGATTRCR